MTARLARYCSLILVVFVLSVWLPQLHTMLFEYRFGKTQMFYSPVSKQFIYTELLGEGHQFIYRDESGKDYSRQEFETLIPFIYYKNMELWGKLPIVLGGQSFDKADIRAERQVIELKPLDLSGHSPRIKIYPLLESNPGRARLSFPENAFHPGNELTFKNSDLNQVDTELTKVFSGALEDAGFMFPVEKAFGRVSILKAYDAGFFLIDAKGQMFHLLKLDGKPIVKHVHLPQGLSVRHLAITESKRREILGIMLDENGKAYLLEDETYRTIPLMLDGYNPDTMELKIIFNPLYRTAIYSDHTQIHAVVMDRDFRPLDHYSRRMAMARKRLSDIVWRIITPFGLPLEDTNSRYLSLAPEFHGWLAMIGNAFSLLLAAFMLQRKGVSQKLKLPDLMLVAITGLYGLIAILLLPAEANPDMQGHHDVSLAVETAEA